jgi:hypothetical protein
MLLDDDLKLTSNTDKPLLKSIIDLIAVDGENVLIIDHKSSVKNIKYYRDQMIFYNIMVALSYPAKKRVYTYISDIKTGSMIKILELNTFEILHEYFPKFLLKLTEDILRFNNFDTETFKPKKASPCKWCYLKEKCFP